MHSNCATVTSRDGDSYRIHTFTCYIATVAADFSRETGNVAAESNDTLNAR
jgi:hypothetical protein